MDSCLVQLVLRLMWVFFYHLPHCIISEATHRKYSEWMWLVAGAAKQTALAWIGQQKEHAMSDAQL